ncbi:glycosyltransferase family 2 protein [Thomasclavelia cocleata]|uniref:glycosyltransferase family 2 protein n=1 Tax=Thomasclavelia cocleata TaxID=69824 RepID=UPI00242F1ABA|nr:glycosyltransferase [Thomasclavelia cocleata]
MDELISVIVPIYNIEMFVERCIKSIVEQSYKNLEIILIDDGSTDSSGDICEKWKKFDSRISVIHKKNGGLSDARNFGLDVARGSYISFIDGDDFIVKDMYKDMLNYICMYNCDICICGICKTENGRKFVTRPYTYKNKEFTIFNSEIAIKEVLNDKIDVSSCNKLYKRNIIGKLRFPYGKTNEDFALIYKLFFFSRKIIVINKNYYKYIQRDLSITTTQFDEKQFDKYYNCIDMLEFVKSNIPQLVNDAEKYLWYQTFCLLKNLYTKNIFRDYKKYDIELRKMLQNNTKKIINCKIISFKEKLIYICISYFPRLYIFINKL